MDLLSSVLHTHQVKGTILSDGRYGGAWGVRIAQPGAAGFHLVLEGACVLIVDGAPPVRLLQGDVVVVPNGAPHVLADDPRTPPMELTDIHRTSSSSSSSSGPQTHLACGAFHFQRGTPPALLSVLPPVIHLRAPEIADDDLLRTTLRLLASELEGHARGAAGASVLVDRLVDVLFVAVIRRWLQTHPGGCVGWLSGLRDEGLGRAMAAVHQDPARDWSVPELARVAGMSRATFARRFDELVGTTPAAFLQGVRLDVATRLLDAGGMSVAEVAGAVGYASEFSFSRTFKRAVGEAPGQYRARRREASARLASTTPTSTTPTMAAR
jgi:AraC-like DNA-binding protein